MLKNDLRDPFLFIPETMTPEEYSIRDLELMFEDDKIDVQRHVRELIQEGYLLHSEQGILPRHGLGWNHFVHLESKPKKQILLSMVENPRTFFILQNTQVGKMRFSANEMKLWSRSKNVIGFFICTNDKTLADQSSASLRAFPEFNVMTFSSQFSTTVMDGRRAINAYRQKKGPMPLFVSLPNSVQMAKIIELMTYVQDTNMRYGMVIDEADSTYPLFGSKPLFRMMIRADEPALYRLGFVTATEGQLLDELQFPECANAQLMEIDSHDPNYRAIHTRGSVVMECPVASANEFARAVLEEHSDHFFRPMLNGEFRKIIVNSNVKTTDMMTLANECVSRIMNAMVFNMEGLTLLRPAHRQLLIPTKGRRFNEVLFETYKRFGLHTLPLIIIGRRKVDRGLSFHYAPRDGSNGLIWTDLILGHVEDRATAVQKAGRLAGVIAQCPQYTGESVYWTSPATAQKCVRHNKVNERSNEKAGWASAKQAVELAQEEIPGFIPEKPVPPKEQAFTDQPTNDWIDGYLIPGTRVWVEEEIH